MYYLLETQSKLYNGLQRFWRHARILQCLLPLTLPVVLTFGLMRDLWQFFPLVIFLIIPLLDRLTNCKKNRLDHSSPRVRRGSAKGFAIVLYVYIVLHFTLLGLGYIGAEAQGWLSLLWLSLSVGLVTGAVGVTVAHELGHRRSRLDRILSGLLMVSVSYLHFLVEHNRGHHRRVATPEDPATARFGETLYQFLPRTLVGSYRSAWNLEIQRLKSLGHPTALHKNLVFWSTLLPVFIFFASLLAFGAKPAVFFAAQSITAILLLETVNYIEHYGLQRTKNPYGNYERVGPQHSWSSNRRVANVFLFNLLMHAHHHIQGGKKYQELQCLAGSPELPCGYAELIVTAWIPPLWKRRIHPVLATQTASYWGREIKT